MSDEIVTHPLVLLSIVDQYNRVARDSLRIRIHASKATVVNASVSSLAGQVKHKMTALERLEEIKTYLYYLENVLYGKIPVNHQILFNLSFVPC